MRRQSVQLAAAIGCARAEGLSQRAIAERCGCSIATVRRYLRPEVRDRERARRSEGYNGLGGPALVAFQQLGFPELAGEPEASERAERAYLSISMERSTPAP